MSLSEVRLRIQVIDIEPRQLDVTVPRYIPVSDLSQRVVRDAGMQSHWPNRFRRHYYIHARGRMLEHSETLESVGLVDGELIYLLPQPDAQLGVLEQNPEYPEVKPYLGQGLTQLMLSLFAVLLFSFLWGMALSVEQSTWTAILPSLGLSSLCVAVARHAWGGWAFNMRIGGTALLLYVIALIPPLFAPTMLAGVKLSVFFRTFAPGIVLGLAGLIFSWIAWWGPVEPLNRKVLNSNERLNFRIRCLCAEFVNEKSKQNFRLHAPIMVNVRKSFTKVVWLPNNQAFKAMPVCVLFVPFG